MIPAVKHPIEPICLLEEGAKNSVDKKNINIFNSCGVFSKQLYGRDKSKRSNIAQIPVRKKKKNVDDFRWYTSVWSDNKLYDREEMLLDIS